MISAPKLALANKILEKRKLIPTDETIRKYKAALDREMAFMEKLVEKDMYAFLAYVKTKNSPHLYP